MWKRYGRLRAIRAIHYTIGAQCIPLHSPVCHLNRSTLCRALWFCMGAVLYRAVFRRKTQADARIFSHWQSNRL